jgi:hypothetical protein
MTPSIGHVVNWMTPKTITDPDDLATGHRSRKHAVAKPRPRGIPARERMRV